jgi:WD40 repeat protein
MSKKPISAVVVPSPKSTFSSILNIPFEHPVTSLSISPLGNEAVLAAKRGLYIINLENPFESPKILHHLSKWDVADCAWNPHISRQEWIVTTSNTKALIWNVHRESASSKSHVEFVLNKHLRAISDIHWSPFLPELVATCSYDAYVHLWDLRTSSEKPSMSFCGWNAGATQVKFNRVNEYLLASSHDTDERIWDSRKGIQTLLSLLI